MRHVSLFLFLTGCMALNDISISDGGREPDSQDCLAVSTLKIDFGTYDLNEMPEVQTLAVEFLCTEGASEFWSLDDPDDAFTITERSGGMLAEFDIQPTVTTAGKWEAQIMLTEPFSGGVVSVQLFAESVETAEGD